jgi:hypothetical protein
MTRLAVILAFLGCLGFALAQGDQAAKSTSAEQKKPSAHKAGGMRDQGGTKEAIMDMEKKLRDAALKGDASVLQQSLAEGYHSISAVDGQAHTKDESVNNLKQGKLKYQNINVSDDDVQVFSPTLAIAHGLADVKGSINGQDFSGRYHYSRTWMKHNGKWEAVWFQSTKLP